MAGDCIPVYEAAYTQKLTVHFGATVYGRRFCAPLSGFQSSPLALDAAATGGNLTCPGLPSAGGPVGGVVMYDSATGGGKGGVIRGAGTTLPVISGAAVDAGDEVEVDNAGKVIPFDTAGVKVGRALTTVAGPDLEVVIELYSLEGVTV